MRKRKRYKMTPARLASVKKMREGLAKWEAAKYAPKVETIFSQMIRANEEIDTRNIRAAKVALEHALLEAGEMSPSDIQYKENWDAYGGTDYYQ